MPVLPNEVAAPVNGRRAPSIRRNLIFNMAGVLLPLLAAFVAVPLLVSTFGLQRFGVFMLLMAAMAYVGLLDLGLGAAVTYRIPALIAQEQPSNVIVAVVRTALVSALALGAIASMACLALAGWVSAFMTESSPQLIRESVLSLRILALAIPAIYAASVLGGVLSAHGEFVMVNKVRIPAGVLTFLAPALTSLWWPDLVLASSLMMAVRLAVAAVHLWQCTVLLPGLWQQPFGSLSPSLLASLIKFGGWLTLSNIVGPFMVYMDRFYLAALRTAADVASYVTPYELASKLTLMPAAVLPVLFPIFVAGWVRRTAASDGLPPRIAGWVGLACSVPAAFLAALAPEILGFWLNHQLPADSAVVLQVLAGAVLVNCVAQVFFLQVQSRGRTDIIARIHLSELLGYGVLLWLLTERLGLIGVALAWAIRATADAALFCHVAVRPLSSRERILSWTILASAIAYGATLAALGWVSSLSLRMAFVLVPLVLACLFWQHLIALWRTAGPRAPDAAAVEPLPHG